MALDKIINAESSVRLSAFLGHDQDEVIADLVKNYDLDHIEAVALMAREYVRRELLDDQDAVEAEFDID